MKKSVVAPVITLVVIGFILAKLGGNGTAETVSPVTGDLVRTVKISGKVVPRDRVELGFEISGTVSSINRDVGQTVRRGDTIARIDTGGISSNILKAEAELALAKAELDKLDGAGVYEAQISNAKQSLIQTIVDAYSAADDAVYNKTDQFMLDPNSNRPNIGPTFDGYIDLRDSIIEGRVTVGELLESWKTLTLGVSVSTYSEVYLTQSKKYLAQVSSYINDVSRAASLFETDNYFPQTTIDSYKTASISARNNLNSASQDLIASEDNLNGLLLEVPVQIARVEAARASLANYRSQLSKSYLVSPMDGLISRQEAKVGQVVSSGANLVSVISTSLEIEAFIPEVLISGVGIGNPATITLDAYGETETFSAKITHIDPAETIRDGVSTYKVRLSFTKTDNRVRSGMTANINIETFRKNGVRLIPERSVFREDGETFVYILSANKSQEKVAVNIGEKDSMGNVELISDLPQDSELIINSADK